MKRITRARHLTRTEAAKYKAIRKKLAAEMPQLLNRHEERMASLDRFKELMKQLRAERQRQGLSLADMTELTGMDRSALSKLETGQRPNPTIETLLCYAAALGKRLALTLADPVEE